MKAKIKETIKPTQASVNGYRVKPRKNADGVLIKDYVAFFDRKPGFGLRVRLGDDGNEQRRTYVYQYKRGGLNYKMVLGNASSLPFSRAKEAFEAHQGDKAKGQNPALEKRKKEADERAAADSLKAAKAKKTLLAHVADYLEWKERRAKPRTLEWSKRLLEKDYWKPLHDLALDDIDRAMVASRIRDIVRSRGSSTGGQARIALSHFFKWAIAEGLCHTNPVAGTNRPEMPKSRKRVLTEAELAAVWRAAPDSDFGRIVKLLMLTGQRRDEIGGLRWSEVDLEDKLITLPPERLKNGNRMDAEAHTVPLSKEAAAILEATHRRSKRDLVFGDGERGFSGWSAAKRALDATSGVKDWRLHDLRRTASTRMNENGVAPHVVEMVLNHISGFRGGVAGVYNRAQYDTEKRAAISKLASYIKTAVAAQESGNVRRLLT